MDNSTLGDEPMRTEGLFLLLSVALHKPVFVLQWLSGREGPGGSVDNDFLQILCVRYVRGGVGNDPAWYAMFDFGSPSLCILWVENQFDSRNWIVFQIQSTRTLPPIMMFPLFMCLSVIPIDKATGSDFRMETQFEWLRTVEIQVALVQFNRDPTRPKSTCP